MKDWRGNTNSMFKVLGASNHTDEARADRDFYATDPACMAALLEREDFCMDIWEPACGMGHLTKPLQMTGRAVRQSDIVDRQQNGEVEVRDFLLFNEEKWDGDIITNPPYAKALEFVEQALRCVSDGHKVAMFLKIQFLEGKARRRLFDGYPPRRIYVFTERQKCAKNGDFGAYTASCVCYAWFVWEKGNYGDTIVRWI